MQDNKESAERKEEAIGMIGILYALLWYLDLLLIYGMAFVVVLELSEYFVMKLPLQRDFAGLVWTIVALGLLLPTIYFASAGCNCLSGLCGANDEPGGSLRAPLGSRKSGRVTQDDKEERNKGAIVGILIALPFVACFFSCCCLAAQQLRLVAPLAREVVLTPPEETEYRFAIQRQIETNDNVGLDALLERIGGSGRFGRFPPLPAHYINNRLVQIGDESILVKR